MVGLRKSWTPLWVYKVWRSVGSAYLLDCAALPQRRRERCELSSPVCIGRPALRILIPWRYSAVPPSFYTLRTTVRRTTGATSVEMGCQQGSSHIAHNDGDVRGCSLGSSETRERESGVLGPVAPPLRQLGGILRSSSCSTANVRMPLHIQYAESR